MFPHMRAQGAERLEALLEMKVALMDTCYLTTEQLTPELRAADVMAAFADEHVAAVVCAIGGDDAIRVIKHLDAHAIASNPKPFLGYSDATSIHLFLFELGILSLYGGNLLCQFAVSGPSMHAYTQEAFLTALFGRQDKAVAVLPSGAFQDGYLSWGEEANLGVAKALEENPGWEWHNCPRYDTKTKIGTLWGGCLEVLFNHLATKICLPDLDELAGAILFVETSEVFPPHHIVYSFFQCLGELGYLHNFAAILVGRPQTVSYKDTAQPDRDAYKKDQKRAILRAIREYTDPPLPVIFDLDFGHTDPQVPVPVGGTAHIYPHSRSITFTYERAPRYRSRGGT